jgi:hypothetical protein
MLKKLGFLIFCTLWIFSCSSHSAPETATAEPIPVSSIDPNEKFSSDVPLAVDQEDSTNLPSPVTPLPSNTPQVPSAYVAPIAKPPQQLNSSEVDSAIEAIGKDIAAKIIEDPSSKNTTLKFVFSSKNQNSELVHVIVKLSGAKVIAVNIQTLINKPTTVSLIKTIKKQAVQIQLESGQLLEVKDKIVSSVFKKAEELVSLHRNGKNAEKELVSFLLYYAKYLLTSNLAAQIPLG